MGLYEALATINLLNRIPARSVDLLRSSAEKHGMVKGPVTHAGDLCSRTRVEQSLTRACVHACTHARDAMCMPPKQPPPLGLASKMMAPGEGPTLMSDDWTARMKNKDTTVELLCRRVVNDFENTPASMRKPAGPEQVARVQRVCRVYELAMECFAAKVPADIVAKETPAISAAFLMGSMDAHLYETTECCPMEIDIDKIPEMKQCIMKLEFIIESEAVRQKTELRKALQTATFQSMSGELSDDKKKVEHYLGEILKRRAGGRGEGTSASKESTHVSCAMREDVGERPGKGEELSRERRQLV